MFSFAGKLFLYVVSFNDCLVYLPFSLVLSNPEVVKCVKDLDVKFWVGMNPLHFHFFRSSHIF